MPTTPAPAVSTSYQFVTISTDKVHHAIETPAADRPHAPLCGNAARYATRVEVDGAPRPVTCARCTKLATPTR